MVETVLVFYPIGRKYVPFSTSKTNHYQYSPVSVVPINKAFNYVGLSEESDSLLVKHLQ